ncbi:uncharacterized protein LOC120486561 [Pimephales promelas]|uniref:uncharacterized protein LOC120486561 n=1 Tax=Pimephales promelas TaxID=90988 RepID=UPI001955DA95|nr:uncharacterized protein LOC120486561 [Pimephales promelas]
MLDGVSEDNISTLNAARLSLVFHKGKDFDTCHQAVMLFISTSIEKLIRVDMYEAIHLSKTMQQYHVSMGWRQDSPDSSGSRQGVQHTHAALRGVSRHLRPLRVRRARSKNNRDIVMNVSERISVIYNRRQRSGVFGVGSEKVSVSVMEGESVTFYTGVQTIQQEEIKWYFYGIRIARINGDQSKICTDVQCNGGTERFRDRLKLDNQTGSLTITHTTNTDSGEYEVKIISSSDIIGNIFNISVNGVSAVEIDEVKRESAKEGEYVTFDPGVIKNPHDVMTWYYNNTLIAEITGDQRQICTDDQCKERFRDRLKLDHQTGSLTITHITNTHSGEYQLVISIINSSFSISRVKRFDLTVIDVPGSGLSPGAVAGICVAVVLLVSVVVGAAVAVIYYRHHENNAPPVQQDEGDADNPPSDPNDIPVENKEHPGDAENLRPDPEIFPFEDMAHPGDADKPPADPNENHL